MALTDTQKAKIRRELGYPDHSREIHQALESAMSILSAEGQVEVEDILTKIAAIDTAGASQVGKYGFTRIEDIWLNSSKGLEATQYERDRLRDELAAVLGVSRYTNGASSRGGPCLRG